MKEMMAVFIGGGMGSLARYGISNGISNGMAVYQNSFPLATFLTNLLSCLVAGIIVAFIEQKILIDPLFKSLLIVGFCGGFSTFSTLIRECLLMLEQSRAGPMLLYSVSSVILGLLSMVSGIWLGKMFTG